MIIFLNTKNIIYINRNIFLAGGNGVQRRDFLKSLLRLFGLTTILSFLYPVFKFLVPVKVTAKYKPLELDIDLIPAGEVYKTTLMKLPIIILHHPRKGFIALSRVCTHLGCLVDYDRSESKLICPCHGANFTVEGRVISGPPPKPLQRIPLVIKDKKIIIG